ncbi:MAG: S-layer homology domain-containing protein [Ruminococcaceae bacterium]|nr:S-layer homology domain-containing protein [Oscillospiraceae bacterium]
MKASKRTLQKLHIYLLVATLIFSVSVSGYASETSASFVYDVEGRPELDGIINNIEYDFLSFRVKDVYFDSESNTVTFKNDQKRKDGSSDTNVYIINNNSALSRYDDGTYSEDVEKLIYGKCKWVTLVLKANISEQILSGMNDTEIFVDGLFWSFNDSNETYYPKTDFGDNVLSFKRITNYNIMQGDENGNLNLTTPVTRAEMAQLIYNTLMLQGAMSGGGPNPDFSDIPVDHWAFGAIHYCKVTGIINGMCDGTYAPYLSVTNVQAIKMIVSMLGYAPLAEQDGGYPDGYMIAAENLGITNGMTIEANAPALRQNIAYMLERALDVPLMEQTGFGSKPQYTVFDGTNGKDFKTLGKEWERIVKN